jgi:hypothetical protein
MPSCSIIIPFDSWSSPCVVCVVGGFVAGSGLFKMRTDGPQSGVRARHQLRTRGDCLSAAARQIVPVDLFIAPGCRLKGHRPARGASCRCNGEEQNHDDASECAHDSLLPAFYYSDPGEQYTRRLADWIPTRSGREAYRRLVWAHRRRGPGLQQKSQNNHLLKIANTDRVLSS